MQRLAGMMLVTIFGSAVLTGCAFRDVRDDYAYSRASDGLWGDRPFELIDWNFPTSANQGPIEVPQRFRPERTAIGVTWATRNPLPLSDNLAPAGAPVRGNDVTSAAERPVAERDVRAAADRERTGTR
jgi:hypothetical protein